MLMGMKGLNSSLTPIKPIKDVLKGSAGTRDKGGGGGGGGESDGDSDGDGDSDSDSDSSSGSGGDGDSNNDSDSGGRGGSKAPLLPAIGDRGGEEKGIDVIGSLSHRDAQKAIKRKQLRRQKRKAAERQKLGTKQWEAEMAKKEQRRLNREARASAKVAAATAKEMEEDAEEKARRARVAGNDRFK